jgi:ABC-2 type transport system ATP-binding protein
MTPPLLRVEGLRKRFGGREVLLGVSFTCAAGENAVLLGQNGAGKSTVLRVLAGVIEPEAGEATLEGASLLAKSGKIRARIGYVPEGADPPPHLTTAELLDLVVALKRADPPPPALLERLGVPPLLEQPIQSLSLGQRRRACLAAALVGDPVLLLLDEPTNGLDPGGIATLAELLRERRSAGRAALVTTHDLAFADAIEGRRVALSGGRVLS